jgi:putative ABC transport system permease protein
MNRFDTLLSDFKMKNMGINFFRTGIRFIWRKKSSSILTFACLAFGLTCSILGTQYVIFMTGFDKFHRNLEKISEVEAMVTYFNGARFAKEPLSASLSDTLKVNIPEIELITRITERTYTFINADKSFEEQGIYADENFFDMFSFAFITRKTSDMLSSPDNIIISERMAGKLFGTSDCTGKSLILRNNDVNKPFKITGVIKNVPQLSTLQFDFVIPFSRFITENRWADETGASAAKIFLMIGKKASPAAVNLKIRDLIKHQETTLNQELFLFPLKEKNLYSYVGMKRVWNKMQSVVIISSIGFAILLIACFNYINITIAKNLGRNREVGVKKTFGASNREIAFQFLSETIIVVIAAMILAIVTARGLITSFNTMVNADLGATFSDIRIIPAFAGLILLTVFVAGFIPSVYLSSGDPVSILRTNVMTGHNFRFFRQALVVLQFTIPVILIICLIIIKVQDNFMQRFDIGVEREKLIILGKTTNIDMHRESFKADLLSVPGIESVSFSNCIPTRGTKVSNDVSWPGKEETDKFHFWCINSDLDYNKVIRLKMVAGRYFEKSFTSDSGCYVINDVAAKVMKLDDPVGMQISLDGRKGTVIGVFKDFHSVDLRGPCTPTIISLKQETDNVLIKFSHGAIGEIRDKIKKIYGKYESDVPYQPVLFNDLPDFAGLKLISDLVGLAFIIAITLACLGLYGLTSFTAEIRTKEIAIRKVNGATTVKIVRMLLEKDTIWLIISFIIAIPVAFIIGRIFLAGFYFKTGLPLEAFILGPAIALLVAMLAVSRQSWKSASKDPSRSLKYD